MPSIDAYKPDFRVFAMHAGDSGSGKSAAAASYPKPYNQIDCDLRFAGISGACNAGWLNKDGIEFIQFHPRSGWEPLNSYLNSLEIQRISGTFPFASIELASLGSLTRMIYNYSIRMKGTGKGKEIGIIKIGDPGDIKTESEGTHQVFDFLRSFPCNLICSAHIVEKYGKVPGASEYAPAGVIGHKLAVRDNLGANVITYFNDVFLFTRQVENNVMKFYVEFSSDLAKNSYGIPPGRFDITNKPFYPFLQELIQKIKAGEELKPKTSSNSGE